MATYQGLDQTENNATLDAKCNTGQCGQTKRPKVNKNAVPRRPRQAMNNGTSSQTFECTRATTNTQTSYTELSSPDLEMDTDSAIGDMSSTLSMSFEDDIPEMSDEIRNLDLKDSNDSTTKQELSRLENRQTISNTEESHDVRTDGSQSDTSTSDIGIDGPVPIPPSTGISAAPFSPAGLSDFVILHTDQDLDAAIAYKDHLHRDIGIWDLSVDLFSSIDAGKSEFNSLATLFDRYRYILTYVTKNLESDRYTRFVQEIIITSGLRQANGKENRLIPIFTENGHLKIIEISIIKGFQYFRFLSESGSSRQSYVDSIKQLVLGGRAKFP